MPRPGAIVHGVLWRLGARDLAAINAYESIDSGLYLRRILPVRSRQAPACRRWSIFCAGAAEGTPRPGYVHLVVEAARDWGLPERYVDALRRWSPSGWRGTRPKDTGEIG